MKKIYFVSLLLLGILLNANISANAQNYNLDFKVRELTKGTGNNISNVRVDIDNGSYIGFTDVNGVAHIPQIPAGNHTINMSKEDYLEFTQANYTLNGNKTFNASIPTKTQTGPWGTTTLNADWYKATFIDAQDAGATGQDPYRWAQIIPINNRIVAGKLYPNPELPVNQTDSALVLQAIVALEHNTGYDLINIVNVPYDANKNYNIHVNSNTDFSNIETDINNIVFAGNSQLTATNQTKRVIHEIVKQFDMWPMQEPVMYPSVMDPAQQTMTDPKPYDYMHIALTISEHKAKVERKEQDLFLGNMYNYSVLITPVKTAVTSPANNATGLDKLVRLTWNNVIDANKYNVDIATDAGFTNIVYDFNAQRIDTTLTHVEDTKYYMRVRAENTTANATWSDVITFTTKPKINHAPTQPVPTSPISSETKDATAPITFTWTSSTDSDNDPITYKIHLLSPKDTTINNVVSGYILPANKLNGHTIYTYNIIASDGKLETTSINAILNTINHAPSAATNLNPNSSIDATQNNNFTWTKGSDIDKDALTQKIIIATTAWDTTINNITSPYTLIANKLKGHTNYTWKIITSDGITETTSNTVNFSTINHAPTQPILLSPNNSETNDATTPITVTWIPSTDKDNDPIKYKIHYWNATKDVTIDNITLPYIIPANNLEGHNQYTYTIISNDGITNSTSIEEKINTINHAPSAFEFTKPVNNERIEYTNHNLEIGTTVSTDKDNDPLTKIIRLVGGGLDTLLYTDATTQTIYLESNKLKLNTEYTLTGEVTDNIATTQATNSITFKTPTGVGLEELIPKGDLRIYPNPTTNYINIEAQIQQPLTINIGLYDATGKQVMQERTEKTYSDYREQVDMSKLPMGVYLLNIEAKTENNEIRREAIKIQKR